MANRDYLPTRDLDLLSWAQNASAKITLSPPSYGLSATDATNLANLVSDYDVRLAAALAPATRSKVTVQQKQTSKAALKAKIRQLMRIVNADPDTTDGQRAELGLTVPDREPTVIGAPASMVRTTIEGTYGFQALLRLADDADPESGRRAAGSQGALLYYKIAPAGEPAPATPDDCRNGGLATRLTHAMPLPAGNAGKMLWVMARWYTSRGELGPMGPVAGALIAA